MVTPGVVDQVTEGVTSRLEARQQERNVHDTHEAMLRAAKVASIVSGVWCVTLESRLSLTRTCIFSVLHYQTFSDKTGAAAELQSHITVLGDVVVCMSPPANLENWAGHTSEVPRVSSTAVGEDRLLPGYDTASPEVIASTVSEKKDLLSTAAARTEAGTIHHESDIYQACLALDEVALAASFKGKPVGTVEHKCNPGVVVKGVVLQGSGKLGDYHTSVGGRIVKITEVKREKKDVVVAPLRRVATQGPPPPEDAMPSTMLAGWEFAGCHGLVECMMQADGAASTESHQGRVLHVTNARFHRFGIHQRRFLDGRWVDWFWWDSKLWDVYADDRTFLTLASLIRQLVVYVTSEFPECAECASNPSAHLPQVAAAREDPEKLAEVTLKAARTKVAGKHTCSSRGPRLLLSQCLPPSSCFCVPLFLRVPFRTRGALEAQS